MRMPKIRMAPNPNPMAVTLTANSRQVGGTHYKEVGRVEHWDIVWQWKLDYYQGQITKYVMRWRAKGGIADLEKAQHFLDKYIELARGGQVPGLAVSNAPGRRYKGRGAKRIGGRG